MNPSAALVLATLAGPALAQPEPPAQLAAPAPGSPQTSAAAADPVTLLAQVDDDYRHRDEPGRLEEMAARLDEAERLAPGDYGVLWRQARRYFWISDDPKIADAEKSKIGKTAWAYADRATAANPKGVEGWYFAATGMGNYSLGIGIFRALGEGIEGKFRDRLKKAEAIDPGFYDGGIPNAWGRFYFKLPWPKYDAEQSEKYLLAALKVNPANVRARVYLADLYRKEGQDRDARAALEKALDHAPGAYDAPEERRMQEVARAELAKMK